MDTHLLHIGANQLSRFEDFRLLTGSGTYASDWNLPGQLHASFLRSDRAHARIKSIDTSAARKHPGVALVLTGEDAVRAGFVKPPSFITFTGKNDMKPRLMDRPVLAHGKVRFVGEPVAIVVAESALIAQDAAELIDVVYEELAPVVDPVAALKPGAPLLHDNVPGNMSFEYEAGDAAAVEAAFARAAHVSRLTVDCTKVIPAPMEPRACLLAYDKAKDHYLIHVCVQGVNMMKRQLGAYCGIPEEKITVMAKDVGGGFGQRSLAYPEYCACLLAARETGRPVKWISSRSESFASDTHGRGNLIGTELALDRDGRFLALRLDWVTDMGAYLTPTGPVSHMRNPTVCMTGVYRIPAMYGYWRVAHTNTAPVAAYRGAGRPDIAYAIERQVDHAAVELKIDPAELRRRNFIPPEAFPYKTPTGSTYDNADLPGLFAKAMKLADADGFAKRRAASERNGKLRGFGFSTVIENTGAGMYPKDQIELEVDAGGGITAYSVAHSQGQSHETTFAMIVANALGVPTERVAVRQGLPEKQGMVGNHTGGSRTIVGAGSVCHIAANKLIEHGKSLAAEAMGSEPSQVDYAAGEFRSRDGTKKLTLADIAASRTFKATGEGTFTSTFPNGCHVAEVEIDPQTGETEIAAYTTVDDCGVVINHTVVEGQMHGAVAQGAGQVFGEHAVYDAASGQLLTGSFMDYIMPRAGLLPDLRMEEHATTSKLSPLGVKGMGESGCTASLGALVNAVMNAVRPLGIAHLDMPLTPLKMWRAIQNSKAGK